MWRSGGIVMVAALMVLLTGAAQETTTSCPVVTCAPGCEPVKGPNGCSKCACPPTCENVTCDNGYACELQKVQCFTTPCFPQPSCVPRQETTTPCPMVTCAPGCELDYGPNGCSECACPPTCENVTCNEDEKCVLKQVYCIRAPCFPIPDCVPKNEATTPCPMVTCAPGCEPVKGPNGCSECTCPPTCVNVTCDNGYVCELQDVQCFTTPCFPQPNCVPRQEATTVCPLIKCAQGCDSVKAPDGCSKCVCPRTCANVTCTEDKECLLKQVYCFRAPCFPIPSCVPKSVATTPAISDSSTTRCVSKTSCGTGCQRLVDSDGCPYCDCPPTCEVVKCRDGYECKMQVQPCLVKPCPTRPVCVPMMNSCTGAPNTKSCGRFTIPWLSFWFYNSTANACQKFRYYGCTPSPNTFLTRKACEDRCKRRDQPICIAIACADGCSRLKRRNQCPRCICPDPCKNFKCSADKVCQLREVTCVTTPCNPEPYCAPKSCPTQAPCAIRCMNGLKTDENGCALCECL